MKTKYFLITLIGSMIFLAGMMWFFSFEDKLLSVIVSSIGLGLLVTGEYLGKHISGNESGQRENINTKHEKEHYETLISIYKYTGGIIVLLIGIAAWVIGPSLFETRKNLTEGLDSLKDDFKDIRSDADQSIREAKGDADKQIEYLRKNTELFLNLTKDITSMQISTLREDAKNLALSSARARIEEAFKANNIQLEIEKAARNEIGTRLEEIVQKEFERTTMVLEDLPTISSLYEKIFWGEREALNQMDSLVNYSDNPTIKRIAEKSLLNKGIDYERALLKEYDDLIKRKALKVVNFDSIYTKTDSLRIKLELINIILTDNDLYKVTSAFLDLRKLSGINLKTFDLNAVRKMKNELF